MKYLSVCSGIEAATIAWHPLGWQPVGFSEIEPFPSAVLAHHYPHVPNFGDMTKFKEWPLDAGAIDLLVGGTPCQSFSVAGLRQGLKDPRGNLMLTYLAIAARLRPRWVVWENVPGVLSSNEGRDFGSFLGGLGQLGYGFAYRVLDAQWCRTHGHSRAVPQRRRRVFVVGRLVEQGLGDRGAAAKVLFERESVLRNSKTRGATREEIAADVEGRVGAGCWWDGESTSHTLTKCGANGAQRMPDKDNFGAVLQPFDRQTQGVGADGDPQFTLQAAHSHAVAIGTDCYNGAITGDVAATMGTPGSSVNASGPTLMQAMTVRRLTPRECERLQGFPDDYTLISWRKKAAGDCPDGSRYKALGNSMAVNCMEWIGERIAAVETGENA